MSIPLLHIADAAASKLKTDDVSKVDLFGTKFTIEKYFYKDCLNNQHGIELIVPNKVVQQQVYDVVYNELLQGVISVQSRLRYVEIISKLNDQRAQGVN